MSLEKKLRVSFEETNFEMLKKAFFDFYRSYDILATSSRKNDIPTVAVTYGGSRYLNGGSRKVIEICCPNLSKLHHISQRDPIFALSHSGEIGGQRVIPKHTTYRKMPVIQFMTKEHLYKIYFGTYKLSSERSSRLQSRIEDAQMYADHTI